VDFPEELTPDSVLSWCMTELGYCQCMPSDGFLNTLRTLLEWCSTDGERKPFHEQFIGNEGLAYLCLGALERAGLVNHGSSIRCPFLEGDGSRLLAWIRTVGVEAVWEVNHGL
jgi:hypothetical protein